MKGAAAEREVQGILEAEGWVVHRVKFHQDGNGQWRQDDLFGFGDLLAMKPGEVPRMIQVTDGGDLWHRRRKARIVSWAGIHPELWHRVDGAWVMESPVLSLTRQ